MQTQFLRVFTDKELSKHDKSHAFTTIHEGLYFNEKRKNLK